MPSERDYNTIERSMIYKIRLIFSNGEKETYTKQEITELLDKLALAKEN